ncbi:MAG: quinone-dependent dihydroorotate dehydrogenase [Myxococcaceae bacterium]|nr:quinone-dependent dihydroorotate dehydrogenase [Myxococcaceae bacterium]
MYAALRPLLFRLPAETAHHAGIWALSLAEGAPNIARWHRNRLKAQRPALAMTVAGLTFSNPVGIAAGLDKNAEAMTGLFGIGPGFIEVGTVTPRAQEGNATPRVFRLIEDEALINRMGFNNAGADAVAGRLREQTWRPGPIGVNFGKNRDTPLERATDDYVGLAHQLGPLADYVVLNLSSPNTPGLRALQEPDALRVLLSLVRAVLPKKPLFLKIAPDLSDHAVRQAVDVVLECKLDALIATNTTLERNVTHALAKETGGLSGRPLKARATEVIRVAFEHSEGTLPIIGVGGISSADDAWEKILAGASLVQIYSGLVFNGPGLIRAILDGLEAKLAQHKLSSLQAAVGGVAG